MTDDQKQDSKPEEGLWDRGQALLSTSPRNMLILIGVILLVGLLIALIDTSDSASHLDNKLLSGSEAGDYARIADDLGKVAAAKNGTLETIHTNGSQDNLDRLLKAADNGCDAAFALVQDGLPWPSDKRIRLLGRLPHPELALFFQKKNPDAPPMTRFAQLSGKRIGIGAEGSGTARVAREMLETQAFAGLDLKLVPAPFDKQMDMLESGEIEVGFVVMNPEAELIIQAIRERPIELISFQHTESLAARIPALHAGILKAGHYDPVAVIPPLDVFVLEVDTLVLTNDCASTSQIYGMMSLLTDRFPSFVLHNRTPGGGSLPPLNSVAEQFLESGDVGFVERTFPWLVDVIPLTNAVQIIMVVSILFNIMGGLHRFRLWRLDANRMATEQAIQGLFGHRTSFETIEVGPVLEKHRNRSAAKRLTELRDQYQVLYDRCRKQSVSILVPMGQEMVYRYQEKLMQKSIDALSLYLERLATSMSERSAEPRDPPEDAAAAST